MSFHSYLKTILVIFGITLVFYFILFNKKSTIFFPKPTNATQIFEGQLEGEGQGNAREDWQKMAHRAAPGIDWQSIDSKNKMKNYNQRKDHGHLSSRSTTSYANGNLTGSWEERGSNNQSGSLRIVEYVAENDVLYGISDGGTLWKGDLTGTNWQALNEGLQFGGEVLQIIPATGLLPQRIIAAIGKELYYSDDDGLTWTASTGLNFYDSWGNPMNLVQLNNPENSIYYLVRTWQISPWGGAVDLYYSNDKGVSFSKIANYFQFNSDRISLWSPYKSEEAYLLENSENLHTISGNTVSLLNTNTNLPTNQSTMLSGAKDGISTTFYALINQRDVYRSNDNGANWILQGSTPVSSWSVGLMVSPFNQDFLIMGAVECHYSDNAGSSWTKANNWTAYYSNMNFLHADIMDLKGFEKTDGTQFHLIANHGGLHITYNEMASTSNISTTGLNIGQYYDVRTDPTDTDYVYAGSQDQGHQRTNAAGISGMANFDQVISGDYGHMAFSANGTSMWTIYPGGWATFYPAPKTSGFQASYTLGGINPPVSNWIFPTAEIPNTSDHEILIAGGNITGGAGSYLVKLTANSSGFSNWSISASQFDYDFRANSTSTTATISAIEVSPINTDRIYVGMSDGSFFFSTDGGNNWTKSTSTGPGQFWLYGASILASSVDENLVWFAGSGYSNSPIYKSTDGGISFTNMNNGLPNTLVQEITANPLETFLYAATEVGVYTYVVHEDMWYPLMEGLPQQQYYSIEYIEPDQVRMGSYGRGIWDFNISNAVAPALPVEWISFKVDKASNDLIKLTWETANEFNNDYFEIQKSSDGKEFESIGEVLSKGDGANAQKYSFVDKFPFSGNNYYRLKQIDKDETFEYSTIQLINFEEEKVIASVFPNPINIEENLNIRISKKGIYQMQLFDKNGKKLMEKEITENDIFSFENMVSGHYFYTISDNNNQKTLSGKILVN